MYIIHYMCIIYYYVYVEARVNPHISVECVQSPAEWFAKRLRDAMQGLGTEDRTLIRILVSRAETDLAAIKREYERLYDKTLESEIRVRRHCHPCCVRSGVCGERGRLVRAETAGQHAGRRHRRPGRGAHPGQPRRGGPGEH